MLNRWAKKNVNFKVGLSAIIATMLIAAAVCAGPFMEETNFGIGTLRSYTIQLWNAAGTFKHTITSEAGADRTLTLGDGDIALGGSQSGTNTGDVTLGADADTVLGISSQVLSLDTKAANLVFAGPTTGSAADPTFRALVAADITGLATTGAHNGTLGATTPAAATVTTLNVSGVVTMTTPQFPVGSRETIPILIDLAGRQVWTAKVACSIVSATEVHRVVCDAADTLTLEKVPSGTAPGSGTVCLAGNFTLNSTVNTNVTVNGHGTPATAALAAGDSLALKYVSGDGTDCVGVVTVTVQY